MKILLKLLLSSIVMSCLTQFYVKAQTLPGNYKTTWAGNTFGGSPDWV